MDYIQPRRIIILNVAIRGGKTASDTANGRKNIFSYNLVNDTYLLAVRLRRNDIKLHVWHSNALDYATRMLLLQIRYDRHDRSDLSKNLKSGV